MFRSGWFASLSLAAANDSMEVIRPYIIGQKVIASAELKPDETIVTVVDRESQVAGIEAMRRFDKDVRIIGEEDRKEPDDGGDAILFDPLDGTSGFAEGGCTPTVIVAYREEGKVVGCTIGEPATGRVLIATDNSPTTLVRVWRDDSFQETVYHSSDEREVRVCSDPVSKKATVTIDVSHGFKGLTTDAQMARLFAGLNSHVKIGMPRTNGGMQMLVAMGGQGSIGSIMTAKGGDFDAAGVLLVLQAGGYAMGFNRAADGEIEQVDPLCIHDLYSLICANSSDTLIFLTEKFVEAMS